MNLEECGNKEMGEKSRRKKKSFYDDDDNDENSDDDSSRNKTTNKKSGTTKFVRNKIGVTIFEDEINIDNENVHRDGNNNNGDNKNSIDLSKNGKICSIDPLLNYNISHNQNSQKTETTTKTSLSIKNTTNESLEYVGKVNRNNKSNIFCRSRSFESSQIKEKEKPFEKHDDHNTITSEKNQNSSLYNANLEENLYSQKNNFQFFTPSYLAPSSPPLAFSAISFQDSLQLPPHSTLPSSAPIITHTLATPQHSPLNHRYSHVLPLNHEMSPYARSEDFQSFHKSSSNSCMSEREDDKKSVTNTCEWSCNGFRADVDECLGGFGDIGAKGNEVCCVGIDTVREDTSFSEGFDVNGANIASCNGFVSGNISCGSDAFAVTTDIKPIADSAIEQSILFEEINEKKFSHSSLFQKSPPSDLNSIYQTHHLNRPLPSPTILLNQTFNYNSFLLTPDAALSSFQPLQGSSSDVSLNFSNQPLNRQNQQTLNDQSFVTDSALHQPHLISTKESISSCLYPSNSDSFNKNFNVYENGIKQELVPEKGNGLFPANDDILVMPYHLGHSVKSKNDLHFSFFEVFDEENEENKNNIIANNNHKNFHNSNIVNGNKYIDLLIKDNNKNVVYDSNVSSVKLNVLKRASQCLKRNFSKIFRTNNNKNTLNSKGTTNTSTKHSKHNSNNTVVNTIEKELKDDDEKMMLKYEFSNYDWENSNNNEKNKIQIKTSNNKTNTNYTKMDIVTPQGTLKNTHKRFFSKRFKLKSIPFFALRKEKLMKKQVGKQEGEIEKIGIQTDVCQLDDDKATVEDIFLPMEEEDMTQYNKVFNLLCCGRVPEFFLERYQYSLYIFSPQNRVRLLCNRIISCKCFDYSILVFIMLNCITLAMERPDIPPHTTERIFLNISNYVFTFIFLIEMIIKLLAKGFLISKHAYLKSGWNLMDGWLVATSLLDVVVMVTAAGNRSSFGIFRVFRLLRTLRPLRVISRAPGLKLVVQTLLSSLRPIGNIVLICCTFFVIFGILGVQLFKGTFYHCEGAELTEVFNKTDCINKGARYRWTNTKYNFDDLGQALMSLFVLASKDGWVNIMYTGLDAVGVNQQPKENHNVWCLFYFISFLLLVGFFVLNMFVGVVVENFHKCREDQEEEERLRRELRYKKKMELKRKKLLEAPYWCHYSKPRLWVHGLVSSKYFDLAISAVICVNVITMSLEYYKMPKALQQTLKVFNYFFTSVFVLECIVKITAVGLYRYISKGWNKLDVLIVLLSIIGIALDEVNLGFIAINPTIVRVVRVMRIARVLKLLKMARSVRALLDTVVQALPEVGNLGLLFFLLFYIFAALGVEMFGRVECSPSHPCEGLDKHAHFQNFGMAFLTLFRVATGDNWNGIMKDTLRDDCDHSEECLKNCCVNRVMAPVFFVVFVLISQFVLVNIVVAVLMKHLEDLFRRLRQEDKERGVGSIKRYMMVKLLLCVAPVTPCSAYIAAESHKHMDEFANIENEVLHNLELEGDGKVAKLRIRRFRLDQAEKTKTPQFNFDENEEELDNLASNLQATFSFNVCPPSPEPISPLCMERSLLLQRRSQLNHTLPSIENTETQERNLSPSSHSDVLQQSMQPPSIILPPETPNLSSQRSLSYRSLKNTSFSRQNAVSSSSTPEGTPKWLSPFDAYNFPPHAEVKRDYLNVRRRTHSDESESRGCSAGCKDCLNRNTDMFTNGRSASITDGKTAMNYNCIESIESDNENKKIQNIVQSSLEERPIKKRYLYVRRAQSHCNPDLEKEIKKEASSDGTSNDHRLESNAIGSCNVRSVAGEGTSTMYCERVSCGFRNEVERFDCNNGTSVNGSFLSNSFSLDTTVSIDSCYKDDVDKNTPIKDQSFKCDTQVTTRGEPQPPHNFFPSSIPSTPLNQFFSSVSANHSPSSSPTTIPNQCHTPIIREKNEDDTHTGNNVDSNKNNGELESTSSDDVIESDVAASNCNGVRTVLTRRRLLSFAGKSKAFHDDGDEGCSN